MTARPEWPAGHTVADLVNDPGQLWPWPFTDQQIGAVADCLPPGADAALPSVVTVARYHCVIRREGGKPNPPAEIELVRLRVVALEEAILALSLESVSRLVGGGAVPSEALDAWAGLTAALGRFRSHCLTLQPLAPIDLRGRPADDDRIWLLHWLDRIWTRAHGDRRPARGWPAFRDAAVAPLALPPVSTKGWEDATTKARRGRFVHLPGLPE